ncbi:hypothetical protein ANN_08401 [Periplaneta americana]|uniref:Reverse transcriptase domain-containing protein n=1 Tax=Periplaneta americana TaxID=6978 RepID=A0ABQ8T1B5_PERAM|nr:hypothetical protein ANN_08401 [Periplaneta americana]
MGRVVIGRRIKFIRFADDMALLAEEEMILKDMLRELNDSCEQYGMKINANKTKNMVVGRKIQKINLRILNEAVDVALYGAKTWTLRRSEEKRIEAFEMWIWRRMERVKWTDRIRNEAVLERVGGERMMLKLIRKRIINWLGHCLKRNCLLKDALEGMVNGRIVRITYGKPEAVVKSFKKTGISNALGGSEDHSGLESSDEDTTPQRRVALIDHTRIFHLSLMVLYRLLAGTPAALKVFPLTEHVLPEGSKPPSPRIFTSVTREQSTTLPSQQCSGDSRINPNFLQHSENMTNSISVPTLHLKGKTFEEIALQHINRFKTCLGDEVDIDDDDDDDDGCGCEGFRRFERVKRVLRTGYRKR